MHINGHACMHSHAHSYSHTWQTLPCYQISQPENQPRRSCDETNIKQQKSYLIFVGHQLSPFQHRHQWDSWQVKHNKNPTTLPSCSPWRIEEWLQSEATAETSINRATTQPSSILPSITGLHQTPQWWDERPVEKKEKKRPQICSSTLTNVSAPSPKQISRLQWIYAAEPRKEGGCPPPLHPLPLKWGDLKWTLGNSHCWCLCRGWRWGLRVRRRKRSLRGCWRGDQSVWIRTQSHPCWWSLRHPWQRASGRASWAGHPPGCRPLGACRRRRCQSGWFCNSEAMAVSSPFRSVWIPVTHWG